jgi:alpha-mannosidase
VLRSPVYANHMPVVPDPDGDYTFIDQGVQHFTYSLLPHAGPWEEAGTVRRAAELNQPPLALASTYHPHATLPQNASFVTVDQENVVLSVVKQAEGAFDESSDLILRAYETAGVATQATLRLGEALGGRTIDAAFGPCEIKTWRVPLNAASPVVETNLLEWTE